MAWTTGILPQESGTGTYEHGGCLSGLLMYRDDETNTADHVDLVRLAFYQHGRGSVGVVLIIIRNL